MWKQAIHNFLETNQIAFQSVQNQSVFELLFIPHHQLYLHLINIESFRETQLPNNYFQNLSEQQNANGFRIIHLWEDVWMSQKDLVQSRILTMIGIFKRLNARHCFIERIDKPTADKFLNDNHLQGGVKAKFKYGLFLKWQYVEQYLGISQFDQILSILSQKNIKNRQDTDNLPINLLAVATFSGGRLMTEETRKGQRSYELLRFASLRGYAVMGGINKLLKSFQSEHNPDDIMTYADRDWSDGRSYKMLGFERIEIIEPQAFMVDNQTFKRFSAKENIENSIKIFNSGSIKFIKKISKNHISNAQ